MADIEEIIDLYAEIPSFHEKYSGLLKQLPPSIINEAWKRLTTRKRNSLSAIDASYEDPSIEALLRREIVRYDQKKKRQLTNSLYIYSMETVTQTGTTDFSDKVDKATQTEDINFLAKIEQANILLMSAINILASLRS
ncbi:14086_t:CDS:1 [Funneliformis caledonium]|uniref:14086_t:CDS:1 n=2 Tax=Funneliformis TaxID=1117308 RepID=A0A9N9ICK1_9GLOM|nr:14086_t:CDS:1 [Funneliformis caledonium]